MPLETYDVFTPPEGSTPPPVEIVGQGNARQLIGYAIVWGAISQPRPDGYRHRFNRGAIVWTPIVHALFQHQWFLPLGSTQNQTLLVTEDDTGVRVRIDLDETQLGRDTLTRVNDRLIAGMSFGGRIVTSAPAEMGVLNITKFVCNEVSAVANPAMTEAIITTAENFSAVDKVKASRVAKNRLNQVKLVMLRPAFGGGRRN